MWEQKLLLRFFTSSIFISTWCAHPIRSTNLIHEMLGPKSVTSLRGAFFVPGDYTATNNIAPDPRHPNNLPSPHETFKNTGNNQGPGGNQPTQDANSVQQGPASGLPDGVNVGAGGNNQDDLRDHAEDLNDQVGLFNTGRQRRIHRLRQKELERMKQKSVEDGRTAASARKTSNGGMLSNCIHVFAMFVLCTKRYRDFVQDWNDQVGLFNTSHQRRMHRQRQKKL